jgi:zinc and cadmium transporter
VINVIILTAVSGIASLAGGLLLLLGKKDIQRYEVILASFAAGVLMTLAVTDLLPEVFEQASNPRLISGAILVGILILFFLEKTSIWWHHHHESNIAVPAISGLIVGDTIHNFIDGMAIAAAYMADPKLGTATAIGVALHELPQEIADFGLCLKSGCGKTKTVVINLLSSMAAILGGVITLSLGNFAVGITPYLLAGTAGMFLYIALADLVPELHREQKPGSVTGQLLAFGLGVVLSIISLGAEV